MSRWRSRSALLTTFVAACLAVSVLFAISAEAVTPTVAGVLPSIEPNTGSATVLVGGSDFATEAGVSLKKAGQSDIVGTSVDVSSSVTLTATFDLTAAAPGAWDVQVTNPGQGSGVCEGCLTVTALPPTVTSANPSSRAQGASAQNITIGGTHFAHGAAATFSGTGIMVNSTSFVDTTHITANITLSATAGTGTHTITVTNTDDQAGDCTGCFTVTPAPTITIAVSPATGVWGTSFAFSGNLKSGSEAIPAKTVTLQCHAVGSSIWNAVGSNTTDSSGVWRVSTTPGENVSCRGVFAGDAVYAAATSSTVGAGVRVGVIVNAEKSALSAGSAAVFKGKVLPVHPGTKVVLQVLTSRGWTNSQWVGLSSASAFRFAYTKSASGRLLFRVAWPTQDSSHMWNVSRNVSVTWS